MDSFLGHDCHDRHSDDDYSDDQEDDHTDHLSVAIGPVLPFAPC